MADVHGVWKRLLEACRRWGWVEAAPLGLAPGGQKEFGKKKETDLSHGSAVTHAFTRDPNQNSFSRKTELELVFALTGTDFTGIQNRFAVRLLSDFSFIQTVRSRFHLICTRSVIQNALREVKEDMSFLTMGVTLSLFEPRIERRYSDSANKTRKSGVPENGRSVYIYVLKKKKTVFFPENLGKFFAKSIYNKVPYEVHV